MHLTFSENATFLFNKNFNPSSYLRVNNFFRAGVKMLTVSREALDGFAYTFMHSNFYGVGCQRAIYDRKKTHDLRFSKIIDMGGMAGASYEFYRSFVSIEKYEVVDRWDYVIQRRNLQGIGIVPKIHLMCWFDYLARIGDSKDNLLFIFSFSLNEHPINLQKKVISNIKEKFINSSILVLDLPEVVDALAFPAQGEEVVVRDLKRPTFCFPDGHFLRKTLNAKRLWL
jgi:hypothetical protein